MSSSEFAPREEFDLVALREFVPQVSFKTLKIDYTNIPSLAPSEEILISPRATAQRRAQFSFGREAAKLALRELGYVGEISIGKGAQREPLFPQGFIGSITHCAESALAAVAPCACLCGIGIDLEKICSDVDQKIISHVATPEERDWILADKEKAAERLLAIFSAKESIYKALNPILKRYIGFKEVTLYWNQGKSAFEISPAAKLQLDLTHLRLSAAWIKKTMDLLCSCVLVGKAPAHLPRDAD